MSFDALAWAAKQRTGSSGTKLVLMGLAECAGRKDGLAFPCIAELVEFSALNRKSVIANLDALEGAGFITDTGDRVGRTKQVKVYRLNLETVPKTEPSQNRNSSVFSVNSPKNGTRNKSEPVISSEAKASSPRAKFVAPLGVSDEQWVAFREQRKKPLNARSYVLLRNKLDKLAEAGWPPGDMIDLAIERGWETVFAPRNFANDRSSDPTSDALSRILNGSLDGRAGEDAGPRRANVHDHPATRALAAGGG
jgi:hypothetical protein